MHELVSARGEPGANRGPVAEVPFVVDDAQLPVLARELVRDRAVAVGTADRRALSKAAVERTERRGLGTDRAV